MRDEWCFYSWWVPNGYENSFCEERNVEPFIVIELNCRGRRAGFRSSSREDFIQEPPNLLRLHNEHFYVNEESDFGKGAMCCRNCNWWAFTCCQGVREWMKELETLMNRRVMDAVKVFQLARELVENPVSVYILHLCVQIGCPTLLTHRHSPHYLIISIHGNKIQ